MAEEKERRTLEDLKSPYTVCVTAVVYSEPRFQKNSLGNVIRDDNGKPVVLDIRNDAMYGAHIELTESEAERLKSLDVEVIKDGHVDLPPIEEVATPSSRPLQAAAFEQPSSSATATDETGERVPLTEMDDQELITYLRPEEGDPPSVNQVTEAVGDDPVLASRVLEAENSASGGEPRQALVRRLKKVEGQ